MNNLETSYKRFPDCASKGVSIEELQIITLQAANKCSVEMLKA